MFCGDFDIPANGLPYLPLRLGRCVSADAAAVFAAFEDFGLLKTFEAALAAFFDVCSLPI